MYDSKLAELMDVATSRLMQVSASRQRAVAVAIHEESRVDSRHNWILSRNQVLQGVPDDAHDGKLWDVGDG